MAEKQLIYQVALDSLELLPEEVKGIIHSKLSAIWPKHLGSIYEDRNAMKAIEELKSLTLKTKHDGSLDQRYKKSITYHHEIGTISGPESSPKKEAYRDENYVQNMKNAYHQDQEILFSLLIDYGAMDKKLDVSEGQLQRNGSTLTDMELCNILDEVTTYILADEMRSISPQIIEMHDACQKIALRRIAVSGTFYDSVLDNEAYKKWIIHLTTIASFCALAVALRRLILRKRKFDIADILIRVLVCLIGWLVGWLFK